jgi:hypothetical protein
MTHTRPDLALSRLELVVLSRLSSPKPPSERELSKVVSELARPSEAANVAEIAIHTTEQLRERGLIHALRMTLSESGVLALRAAFNLDKTPLWKDIHNSHLLARSLGFTPGTEATRKALKDTGGIANVVVCTHFKVKKPSDVADKLICDALGLPPGPMTMGRIRTHMLAKYTGTSVGEPPRQTLVRVAAKVLGEPVRDKRTMSRVLIRRWVYEVTPDNHAITTAPRAMPAQSSLPLPPTQPPAAPPPVRLVAPPTTTQAPKASPPPPSQPPVQVVPADNLLNLVRAAIPRIGADGRFGAEKVFVSAIWHRIERDGRPPDLSYDRFKRWLITANRDQLIDLARADVVGAMDPKLVAESEIEDLGATFHFVVDRRASAAGRGLHA